MVKPTESSHTLDRLAEDVLLLTERFAAVPEVGGMQSFKLLTRLLAEKCVIEEEAATASGKKAVARPNKDVPSDSLQNPSDPDAGYSSHKGQGLSLITRVAVESLEQAAGITWNAWPPSRGITIRMSWNTQ